MASEYLHRRSQTHMAPSRPDEASTWPPLPGWKRTCFSDDECWPSTATVFCISTSVTRAVWSPDAVASSPSFSEKAMSMTALLCGRNARQVPCRHLPGKVRPVSCVSASEECSSRTQPSSSPMATMVWAVHTQTPRGKQEVRGGKKRVGGKLTMTASQAKGDGSVALCLVALAHMAVGKLAAVVCRLDSPVCGKFPSGVSIYPCM